MTDPHKLILDQHLEGLSIEDLEHSLTIGAGEIAGLMIHARAIEATIRTSIDALRAIGEELVRRGKAERGAMEEMHLALERMRTGA